jgi:hypothetical protein
MRRPLIGLGALALLGAVVFAQQRGGTAEGQTGVGSQAPRMNLFDLEGQVFVLEFINPLDDEWLELHKSAGVLGTDGKLEETHEKYKEKGVVWLTICPYVDPAEQAAGEAVQGIARMHPQQLREKVEELDLDMPVLLDQGGEVMQSFGITRIPYVVIVDKQGRIAYSSALRGESGQLVGLDTFDRAVGEAVEATYQPSGTLPASAPREDRTPAKDREPARERDPSAPDRRR